VAELPENKSAVLLEIGCGTGSTGALAKKLGKCGKALGVELMPGPAAKAATVLDEVLTRDVEEVEFPWPAGSIDILVLSEVLEHLRDPSQVLRRVRHLLKPGARVFASSPNIAHHRVIRMLLRGRWDLTEMGPMDRTHLRWFTPRSFQAMFEESGYVVDRVGPVAPFASKSRFIDLLTLGRIRHLLMTQIDLRAHVATTSTEFFPDS
jgi:2-polyprenyl-3-methyl-5-hydroxy-6-metoxy-1,4-benzoquinol methylase